MPKEFEQYLTAKNAASHVGHSDYARSPASAFLKYTIEAKCALDLCIRHLPTKTTGGDYTKNSLDTLQHLQTALLPAVMGHLETFQRYLFAGMFDLSTYLDRFDPDQFSRELQKISSVTIDPVRLSAYRGIGVASMGVLLADHLSGWHNPSRVNSYFGCYGLQHQFWSNAACEKLEVLWQLRHSVVHTGGTLTRADAQKVKVLEPYADEKVIFENRFLFEVSRKLHPIVKAATEGIGASFKSGLRTGIDAKARDRIDALFEVRSSVPVWLK
jgi:hypothetical protein